MDMGMEKEVNGSLRLTSAPVKSMFIGSLPHGKRLKLEPYFGPPSRIIKVPKWGCRFSFFFFFFFVVRKKISFKLEASRCRC
jgi:hypothetical protein